MITAHFNAKRLMLKAKGAFTLIELLIVIAILGILAAAVLIAVNPAKRQNQAKDSNTKADVGAIATALQGYFTSQGGTYPADLATLATNKDLVNVPTPPQGGTYTYAVGPSGNACTQASPCTSVSVANALLDPAVAGNLWCFQSSTGKAQEVTAAAGCPAN